jgi:hypothetical protein
MRPVRAAIAALFVALAGAPAAWACAACNGAPDAAITKGAKAGVFLLLGVIGTVLGGIGWIAAFWARRARALEAAAAAEAAARAAVREAELRREREPTLVG